ncbi:MAG TPA: beta-CASP ribonuclease aCPSF1 [Candidatus Nanoarchaeia archaeon]|nr:beta-CASP ribonuclease aCPSF1 [Candidatus Nanoarchaeia archaeon]
MVKILDEVIKQLPSNIKISEACFEGANIVLYTKSEDFFLDNQGVIKGIVDNIKKRVELRIDPSMCMDLELAKGVIEKLVSKDAGNISIIFDPQRSVVMIEAERPGMVIGKNGEILKEIKRKTLWVPIVKRIPPIRSPLLENIRQVLYENSDYRRKFLHKVGKRIYDGWIRGKKDEWVRISFLGAAREVGRSCYLLQTPESRVLLDCGINVAATKKDEMFPKLEAPEFDLTQLDAVIVSHAHLDHVGAVPYLFKYGYKGPVYLTAPTRDISALLCLDYIGISHKEGKDGIYSASDVKEMMKHCIWLDFEEVTDITPDIRLTFYNSGHNLGSSLVHLHIGNGLHNFLYSGDFNYEVSNLLSSAYTKFPRLETVMMEATYGTQSINVPSRRESEEQLVSIINEIVERKGKILMPVLGVGRSQEVMLIIERNMREGKIPTMPVYIQGMLWDVTALHTAYPDFFNAKVRKSIFQRDHNPFLSEIFKKVGSQKEMKEVIEGKGPYIIMATSGMLTGGASLEYFKAFAENKNNAVVLTSYQGTGSLGRKLEEGEKEIVFSDGKKQEIVNVLLRVYTIQGLSGHSNYKQLISWVYRLDPKPKRVIVVHGEQSRCLELASSIYQLNKIETVAPRLLDCLRLK